MKNLFDLSWRPNSRVKGILLSLAFSIAVLFCFVGPVIKNPNNFCFDKYGGDGSLAYYYTIYHLKHDSSYLHLQACNYPYGESIFFSGNPPLLTVCLKFVNDHLFNVEDSVVGIFNMSMLLSFPLCALFLFLIFYEFKIPYVFGALCAVGITFLSPQWGRLQAHYTLSYAFAIPGLFYFLIRYNQKPDMKRSLIVGIFVFIMASIHIYYIGLLGEILVVNLLVQLVSEPFKLKQILRKMLMFFVQFLLPYFGLTFLIYLSSNVTDRITYPWGFLLFLSDFNGMFFPFAKLYEPFVRMFYDPQKITIFEGISYLGAFAIIISFFVLLVKLWQLFSLKFKKFFYFSEYKMLNSFLLAGILGAIYACGVPFIYNEKLIDSISALRQMRSLGRFAWILYYALNIFAVYYLSTVVSKIKIYWARYSILAVVLIPLFLDAYYNMKPLNQEIQNPNYLAINTNANSPENKWVKNIQPNKYQAIMPLPFFLSGSDNVHADPENHNIINETYLVSLNTGLPAISAILSRTSLAQTYCHFAMILDPYRPLEIVKDFPNKKPFLIVAHDSEIPQLQKNLMRRAVFISTGPGFNLYELPFDALVTFSDSLYLNTKKEIETTTIFDVDGFKSTSNNKNFVYISFDEQKTGSGYYGGGAYAGNIKEYNRIFDGIIPGAESGKSYVMSFWMNDFIAERYPRTNVEILYVDSLGNKYEGVWIAVAESCQVLDGSWALLEYVLKPLHANDRVIVTIWNRDIHDDSKLIIDEFLIRQQGCNLYRVLPGQIEKNNRFYKEKNK